MLHYENKNYYQGKGILITGATGGIGSLLMATLVHLGARVVALVKDEKKLKEIINSYEINPNLVSFEKMDFKLDTNYREVFSKIMYKLKGKLDIMFLCHGQFSQGEIMETILKEYEYFLAMIIPLSKLSTTTVLPRIFSIIFLYSSKISK